MNLIKILGVVCFLVSLMGCDKSKIPLNYPQQTPVEITKLEEMPQAHAIRTMIQAAETTGYKFLAAQLVQLQANNSMMITGSASHTALHQAITLESPEIVNYLLQCRANLPIQEICTEKKLTLLHYAVKKRNVRIIEILLKHSPNMINRQDAFGLTALHHAAYQGDLTIVKVLIRESEIDINVKSVYGFIALHYAAKMGYEAIVLALLADLRTEVNVQNRYGFTALNYAAKKGHLEILKALLEDPRTDVNTTPNRQSALHHATKQAHVDIVKALLQHAKINLHIQDENGETPFFTAVFNHHWKIARILLKKDPHVIAIIPPNYDERQLRKFLTIQPPDTI